MSNDTIWDDIQKIVNTKSTDFRNRMNSNVHCMDVGIAALKASDPSITYSEKEKLHRLFRKEFFIFTSLESAILNCKDSDSIEKSSFVEDPLLGDYIVAPSFATLRTRTTSALKFSKVDSQFTGIDEKTGKTTTNIGHLSLKESDTATTPLELKLNALILALQGAPIASALVSSKIKALHRYHKADTSYAFNRPNFDIKKLQGILGKGTVFVTLQTTIKNKALAVLEGKIEREVRDYLSSDKFHTKLLNNKGSNSILEDIGKGIVASLLGSSSNVPGSLHSTKPAKKTSTALLNNKAVTVSKLPKVRNLQGQFYSLANLQILLNTHLQDVVSANMGDEWYFGGQRRILNYRTGRFAESVKVERLSQSRAGAITAFYNYQKNPYATFSTGGRQASPVSRDPKLLISKSIREIAGTTISSRLRAVLI